MANTKKPTMKQRLKGNGDLIFITILMFIFILLLAILLGLFALPRPGSDPTPTWVIGPASTRTPTQPAPTWTPSPTPSPAPDQPATQPAPTWTPSPSPTATQVQATPVQMVVYTGFLPGFLHLRQCANLPGPGRPCYPTGWLPEGTPLEFIACHYTPMPWVEVLVQGQHGYVYSPFTAPDYCSHD